MEIEGLESVTEVVERILTRYNDSPERRPVGLILFREMNKLLIKIVRALSSYHGCALIVAVKGSGISTLIKLVSYNELFHLLRMKSAKEQDSTESHWHAEMKELLSVAANDDRVVVLAVD